MSYTVSDNHVKLDIDHAYRMLLRYCQQTPECVTYQLHAAADHLSYAKAELGDGLERPFDPPHDPLIRCQYEASPPKERS